MTDLIEVALQKLLEGGGFGYIIAVAEAVVIYLMWKNDQTAVKERLADMHKLIESRADIRKSLDSNALAIEGYNKAMESRTRVTEAIDRTLSDLVRQTDHNDERLLEAQRETARRLEEGLKKAEEIQRAILTQSNPVGRSV